MVMWYYDRRKNGWQACSPAGPIAIDRNWNESGGGGGWRTVAELERASGC